MKRFVKTVLTLRLVLDVEIPSLHSPSLATKDERSVKKTLFILTRKFNVFTEKVQYL